MSTETTKRRVGRPRVTKSSGKTKAQWQHQARKSQQQLDAQADGRLDCVKVKSVQSTLDRYMLHCQHIDAIDAGTVPADIGFNEYKQFLGLSVPAKKTKKTQTTDSTSTRVLTPYGYAHEEPDGRIRFTGDTVPTTTPDMSPALIACKQVWLKHDGRFWEYIGEYLLDESEDNREAA